MKKPSERITKMFGSPEASPSQAILLIRSVIQFLNEEWEKLHRNDLTDLERANILNLFKMDDKMTLPVAEAIVLNQRPPYPSFEEIERSPTLSEAIRQKDIMIEHFMKGRDQGLTEGLDIIIEFIKRNTHLLKEGYKFVAPEVEDFTKLTIKIAGLITKKK